MISLAVDKHVLLLFWCHNPYVSPINDINNPGKIFDAEEVCLIRLSNLLGGGKTDELLDNVDVCKGVNGLSDSSVDGGL